MSSAAEGMPAHKAGMLYGQNSWSRDQEELRSGVPKHTAVAFLYKYYK
jgi:hypothetical protein